MLTSIYSGFILRYPASVLAAVLILITALGFQATKLEIDASSETLMLQDDDDLQFTRKISKRYASQDFLVIAYTPRDDLLSQKTLDTLKQLSSELVALPEITSITSILNIPLLASPPKPIKELVASIPTLESEKTDKALAKKELLSSPIYSENLVSPDFKTTALLLNLKSDPIYAQLLEKRNRLSTKQDQGNLSASERAELQSAQKAFKAHRDRMRAENHQLIIKIRSIVQHYRQSGQLFLGGVNMITDDMISFIKYDLKTYGTILLALLIIVLYAVFRQIHFVILPVLIASLSALSTAGILGMSGWEVTVISSNFISLQLIITMSLVIHLIVRYREYHQEKPEASQKELVTLTIDAMAKPHFFVVMTTITGFSSLVVSHILPVINFGWMMSAGVAISLLITFLVFPTFMLLFKKKPLYTGFEKYFTLTEYLAKVSEHQTKLILGLAGVIAVFSLSGSSQLIVENSFIDYFKKNTEIYQGMELIDRQLGGTTPMDLVVNFPQENAAKPKALQDDFGDFSSFDDEFSESRNEAQYWFTAQKMETIEKVHDYLESIPEIGKVLSFGTMLKVGRTLNEGENLDNFALALLYNEIPEEFRTIIIDPYLDIENNQVRYTMRVVDSQEDLRRNELLQKINTGLHETVGLPKEQYRLSGIMVMYNNMLQSLFDSQIKTLGVVVLILGIMFLILFRSLKVAAIAMLVNIVPVSVVFGLMGWAKIPLDMMTITIAAISLGMAVDNTIHYLHRFKLEVTKDGDYIQAMHRSHQSIGYAMYYTSLAVVIGFSVLVLSNFIPTIYFGLLTVLAIFMALSADLMLLPVLILLFRPFKAASHIPTPQP